MYWLDRNSRIWAHFWTFEPLNYSVAVRSPKLSKALRGSGIRPTPLTAPGLSQPLRSLQNLLMPMDSGIIRCFKSHYRKLFTRLALSRDDKGIEDIYKINQLEAMEMAAAAWDAVSPTTIANCWRHTGILPPMHIPLPPSPTITTEYYLADKLTTHPRMLDPEFLQMMDSLTLDGPT